MNDMIEDITLDSGMALNWKDFTGGTYVEHNGIFITDIGKCFVKGAVDIRPELLNPLGVLHGGVVVTLADTAGIIGCGYLYEAVNVTTVDLSVSFLRPVKTGRVFAMGTALSQGKTLYLWRVDEYDEDDNLVATVNVTYAIMK